MKHLKLYENKSDNIRCTIDIRFLSKNEIIQLCNNLIKFFPDYDFNDRFLEIANNNANYTQWLSDYSHIELSKIYTYFEAGEYDPKYYFSQSGTLPIKGEIFLNATSEKELIENINLYITANKYNL